MVGGPYCTSYALEEESGGLQEDSYQLVLEVAEPQRVGKRTFILLT
jgi:hypothetical protein